MSVGKESVIFAGRWLAHPLIAGRAVAAGTARITMTIKGSSGRTSRTIRGRGATRSAHHQAWGKARGPWVIAAGNCQ